MHLFNRDAETFQNIAFNTLENRNSHRTLLFYGHNQIQLREGLSNKSIVVLSFRLIQSPYRV